MRERDGRALCPALERLRARRANITDKNVVKCSPGHMKLCW